jgi:hypothetical protein
VAVESIWVTGGHLGGSDGYLGANGEYVDNNGEYWAKEVRVARD